MFDEELCGDSDFNLLALFLMYEKIKGEKSFWSPYFQVIKKSYTLLDWKEEELDLLEDNYIKQEVIFFTYFNRIIF